MWFSGIYTVLVWISGVWTVLVWAGADAASARGRPALSLWADWHVVGENVGSAKNAAVSTVPRKFELLHLLEIVVPLSGD